MMYLPHLPIHVSTLSIGSNYTYLLLMYLLVHSKWVVVVVVASQNGFPVSIPSLSHPIPSHPPHSWGIGSGTGTDCKQVVRGTDDLASTFHLIRHWSRAVSLSVCLWCLGFLQRPTRSRVVHPHRMYFHSHPFASPPLPPRVVISPTCAPGR